MRHPVSTAKKAKQGAKKLVRLVKRKENSNKVLSTLDTSYEYSGKEDSKDLLMKHLTIQDLSSTEDLTHFSNVIHRSGMPKYTEEILRYQVFPRTNYNPLNYDNYIKML